MDKKEIWRTAIVDGKENPRYKVSRDGRIICLDWGGYGKPRVCTLSEVTNGYLKVGIDGVLKFVHRIVAETFIPNPEGKPCVDHVDTNRQNNCVWNLRWTTHKENGNNPLSIKKMRENNAMLGKLGAEHHLSVAVVQLTKDGKFIKKWSCAAEVERELGINQGSISNCCRGRQKTAGGYRWMYYSDWLKLRKPKRSLADIQPLF